MTSASPDSTQQLPAALPTHRILVELEIANGSAEDALYVTSAALDTECLQGWINDAHADGLPFAHCVSAVARLDTMTCEACGQDRPRETMEATCRDVDECERLWRDTNAGDGRQKDEDR